MTTVTNEERYTTQNPAQLNLAIVVPCHNEEAALPFFLTETDAYLMTGTLGGFPSKGSYVFVDDGSSDGTLALLRNLSAQRPDIHYLSFSRNFGKEAALLAGMRRALELGATHVAVMDADLQDPPSLLPAMVQKLYDDNLDAVAAYRKTREGEPPVRSWFAHLFYRLENRICDVEMRDGARDFRVMTRRVVEAICSLTERERFSKGLFQWVGFRTDWIGYENTERVAGSTSWSFISLMRYALDGIISFSAVPLEMISAMGIVLAFVALLGLLVVFVRALIFGDPVAGWPSMVCIILMLGGLQLVALGVIGLYLAKALSEVKARPSYFVAEQDGLLCGIPQGNPSAPTGKRS